MAIQDFPENALGIYDEPTWAETPVLTPHNTTPVAPTTPIAAAGLGSVTLSSRVLNYLFREPYRWIRALAHRTMRSDTGLIGSFVATGGTYPTGGGTLSVQLPLTEVYVGGVLVQFADSLASPHVFTASRDSYLIVDADGVRLDTEVANGAGVPAVAGTQVIVSKTVTDGTQVTSSVLILGNQIVLGDIAITGITMGGGLDMDGNSITNVDDLGVAGTATVEGGLSVEGSVVAFGENGSLVVDGAIASTADVKGATLTSTGGISCGGNLDMTNGSISNVTTLAANDVTIATPSYHSVRGSTVLGSTNTLIYRWTSVVDNSGTDIVYTDSGTDGGSWAIAVSGIYNVSMSIDSGHAGYIAIKKAAVLSNTFDATDIMAVGESAVGIAMSLSWTGFCASGSDIWIAANSATNPTGTPINNQRCSVTRVR
jgi:hypothetical protein